MPDLMTFDAAQNWLKSRVNVPTALNSAQLALAPDFPAQVKAHAFFSARVTSANVLDALRGKIDAFVNGDTDLATARMQLKTFLHSEGVARPSDVSTETEPPVGVSVEDWKAAKKISNLASSSRLNLILNQNARMANALGQRQVSLDPDIQERWPYFRYFVGPNPRDSHAALNGLVLLKTDPFWNSHTPPWDYNCNCWLEDCDAEEAASVGGPGKAVVKEMPDGSQTATVLTGNGQTVNLPGSGDFTFRPDAAFTEPDWSLIPAGDLREIVKAEYDKLKPLPPPKEVVIPSDITGADSFGALLNPTDRNPGGSTGAIEVQDDKGKRYVFKTYGGNELQVKNEWLANRFYTQLGVPVAEARLARVDGKLGLASPMIERVKPMGTAHAEFAAGTATAQRGFVADAWLANWDVAGTGGDNILLEPGKKSRVYRVDQGGSLLFRARGTPKGVAFGTTVNELKTLRDTSVNPYAAKLFSKVTDADIAGQIVTFVNKVKIPDIIRIVDSAALPAAQAEELKKTLVGRRTYLAKWRREYLKTASPSEIADLPAIGASTRPIVADNPSKLTAAAKKLRLKLADDERKAVTYFTGSGSGTINRAALRGQPTTELDSALEKLPGYTGYSIRKINSVPQIQEMFDKWKSGEWANVEWKAYSSSSVKPGGVFSDNGGIAFIVRNKGIQGSYVAPLSSHKHEAEMIYGRNSRFVVTGWCETKAGQHRALILDEVTGPLPVSQKAPPRLDYDKLIADWKSQVSGNEVYYSAIAADFAPALRGKAA